MVKEFKFQNLCGAVYTSGNLLFSPDGNSVLSPIGNRIAFFDILNNKSQTMAFQNRKPIKQIALSPDGKLLVTVDRDGRAVFSSFFKKVPIFHFNFKQKVSALKFSPNSKFIAVTFGNKIRLWKSPRDEISFCPLELQNAFYGHQLKVNSINWNSASTHFVTASEDGSVQMVNAESGHHCRVIGHKGGAVAAFWVGGVIYSVSRSGIIYKWSTEEQIISKDSFNNFETSLKTSQTDFNSDAISNLKNISKNNLKSELKLKLESKHFIEKNNAIIASSALMPLKPILNDFSSDFDSSTVSILALGYSDGEFRLLELPSFNTLHSMSMTNESIDSIAINPSGDWIAFASAKLGQMMVWEWQSESVILKQQGHCAETKSISFSPDGQLFATAGEDGKVKLWNSRSGFCFVTFSNHTAPATKVHFCATGTLVLSAGLDGTVRAYDLVKYKNFRTLSYSENPEQFLSVTSDSTGKIISAGSTEGNIHVWNLQTGKILEVLKGHEGPVSGLNFSPDSDVLASSSWDGTVKLWRIFEMHSGVETLQHNADVLDVVFSPDGKQICSCSNDGKLHFWSVEDASLSIVIDGSKDILGGRRANDLRTAKNSTLSRYFTTIDFSPDGQFVIAAGDSKFICIYHVKESLLVQKIQISENRRFDGVLNFLNSRNFKELNQIYSDESTDCSSDDFDDLPGVLTGDRARRSTRLAIRTMSISYSPTGRQFGCITTEGILLYSLDMDEIFDPVELEAELTPSTILRCIAAGNFTGAVVSSLKLNDQKLFSKALNSTPAAVLPLICRGIPIKFLSKAFELTAEEIEISRRIHFCTKWIISLLKAHRLEIRTNENFYRPVLRAIFRAINSKAKTIIELIQNDLSLLRVAAATEKTCLVERQIDKLEKDSAFKIFE